MRNMAYAALGGIAAILLLATCGKEQGNPVSPVAGTHTISGKAFYYGILAPTSAAKVHIKGKGVERIVALDADGEFRIPELEYGKYLLRASEKGYILYPDSVEVVLAGQETAGVNFIAFTEAEHAGFLNRRNCTVFGRITTETGKPVAGVTVKWGKTNLAGYYQFYAIKGDTLRFAPKKDGYTYTFIPDSLLVVPMENVLFTDFTARYSGPPLHSISGRVRINNPGDRVKVRLLADNAVRMDTTADSTGFFSFSDLLDGKYGIEYELTDYTFTRDPNEVNLNGADIILPDNTGTYTGPTIFRIFGRVVDRGGTGFAGIPVGLSVSGASRFDQVVATNDRGAFAFSDIALSRSAVQNMVVRLLPAPVRSIPDSAAVILAWKEDVHYADTIVLPDFIGFDYSTISAADYYPLRPEISWVYDQTASGGSASSPYTMRWSQRVVNGGNEYFHAGESGPGGFTDFRISENSVRTWYRSGDAEFLRFGDVPGAIWEIGRASGSYLITGKFLGLESTTVPAGPYPDCAKFEIHTAYGKTSWSLYTLWFAKGVGMVRSEYVLVNYSQTRESITLELREFRE